jgi:hypothetical protein
METQIELSLKFTKANFKDKFQLGKIENKTGKNEQKLKSTQKGANKFK